MDEQSISNEPEMSLNDKGRLEESRHLGILAFCRSSESLACEQPTAVSFHHMWRKYPVRGVASMASSRQNKTGNKMDRQESQTINEP